MARGLNKVMIIGYLDRDPEMRFTPTGRSVANFSMACTRSWKSTDSEEHSVTEWFNVIAWGDLADLAKQYLTKGSLVYVEGRLQTRTWQDEEGSQRKSIDISARDILLLNDDQINENQDGLESVEDKNADLF